jgi:hypothetical protein
MLEWVAIFILCYLLTNNLFFVGGIIGCLHIAVAHWKLARRVSPEIVADQVPEVEQRSEVTEKG